MRELNIEKANVVTAYYLEDIAKVMQKYGREGEGVAQAFRRMTAEAIKGVRLTETSLSWVEERRALNLEKRMKAREARKCGK